MVAIVERGYDQALVRTAPASHVVKHLVSQLLGILVRPRPAMDVEKHRRLPRLLNAQLVDTIQIHGDPGDIDHRLAGTRRLVSQDEPIVGSSHLGDLK